MVCTVNASTSSSAIVSTADGSGILKIMSNGVTTNALAWVNFSGSATPTIRSSYNVSSITYTATAQFGINFTNTLADANYSLVGCAQRDSNNICVLSILGSATYNSLTTAAAQVTTLDNANIRVSAQAVCVAIFGN